MQNSLNRTFNRMKYNHVVRKVMSPFMNAKYRFGDKTYKTSVDKRAIQDLRGAYAGKRCFIVGNGPSLTIQDLNSLKGEYTFASNRIYALFDETSWRPTFYAASDMDLIPALVPHLGTFSPIIRFFDKAAAGFVKNLDSVILLNLRLDYFAARKHTTDNISFSSDPSKKVGVGYTVTYVCLQLALYMGFSEIYLIGMDHTFSYVVHSDGSISVNRSVRDHCFGDGKGIVVNPQYKEGVEYAYALARNEAEKRGVKICNATRGGSLEVFERISLDEVLNSDAASAAM